MKATKNAFVSGEKTALAGQHLDFPRPVSSRESYITITREEEQLYAERKLQVISPMDTRSPELPESIYNLLSSCTLNLAEPGAESKRKPPVKNQEAYTQTPRNMAG